MKHSLWLSRDSVKDYFPLPKEIFSLSLSAAEIAIYAYLLFCEDNGRSSAEAAELPDCGIPSSQASCLPAG